MRLAVAQVRICFCIDVPTLLHFPDWVTLVKTIFEFLPARTNLAVLLYFLLILRSPWASAKATDD